ncbi:hypothetical protein N0V82_005876 [Gnomoniopsis sp. IMI 355080]|nr:hypothetical protein N0V82_005876 [Gnomoniopsis sp. IMI 355080]
MQISKTLFVVVGFASTAFAACPMAPGNTDPNCCWGGSTGEDACLRQAGGVACSNGADKENFCVNMGITKAECNADCCDTRTRKGKPCNKGANACDEDTGCPN